MDFLISLPKNGVSTSILVVVDRFSKLVHLIPLLSSTEAKDVAAAFFNSVVHLHGLPVIIILDRDPCLFSTFWHTLMKKIYGNYVEI